MAKQTGWTFTGSANFSPTKGAGSSSDRTNLESIVKIVSSESKGRGSSKKSKDGFTTVEFSKVSKSDAIEWEVITTCDGKGQSDRVNLSLTYYDPYYIGRLSDQIIATLTDDEIGNVLAGDNSAVERKTAKMVDLNQTIKTIYSTTVITDSSGRAKGTIILPETYPFADYVLNIHYGYSNTSERSDSAKSDEFIWETSLLVGEIALVVVGSILSGGTLAPALGAGLVGTATVIGAVDIAYAATSYLGSGFGAIDENRHGCLFPIMGFNHSYTFTLDEPVTIIDEETGTETESTAKTQAIVSRISDHADKVSLSAYAVPKTEMWSWIAGGSALVAALLILTKPRGESNE